MRKRRLLLVGLAFLSIMMLPPATAQSSTVVSQDSNLSDTNLTVDFSGLEASSEYELLYVPQDGDFQEIKTFTTSGTGAASVEFRHAPFTRNQDYLSVGTSNGWLYRVETPPDTATPSSQYSFTVSQGNMLINLDTFDNSEINSELFTATYDNKNDAGCSFDYSETNSLLDSRAYSNDLVRCRLTVNLDSDYSFDSVVKFNVSEFSTEKPGEFADPNARVSIVDGSDNILTSYSFGDTTRTESGIFSFYVDDGTAYIEDDGTVVSSSSVTSSSFSVEWSLDGRDDQAASNFELESYSVVPKVTSDAWVSPREFNPSESDLIFGNVVLDGSSVGLEYSADGSSWRSTPPSGLNDNLFYRNTGGGTLNFTAAETGQAFQNLDVTPVSPQNNAVFPIPTNDSLPVDFEYSVFYGEDVESSVTWTLENQTSELSSTIYPDLDAPIDRSFTESATVPIGDYNWTVSVSDSSLGASSSETFSFSVISEENATVGFDLISPSSGEEVSAEDGVDFSYEVQAENTGDLNLWIPELSQTSPQFSEAVGSGTTSRTVNLDVPSGEDLSWYLTFEEDSTGDVYTSQSVQFSTAETGTEPSDGDGGFSISVPDIYFDLMTSIGFSEAAAGYIAGFFVVILTSIIGYVLGGSFGGAAGMSLGLVVSGIVGLFPSWVILVVVFLAGGVTAATLGKILNGDS